MTAETAPPPGAMYADEELADEIFAYHARGEHHPRAVYSSPFPLFTDVEYSILKGFAYKNPDVMALINRSMHELSTIMHEVSVLENPIESIPQFRREAVHFLFSLLICQLRVRECGVHEMAAILTILHDRLKIFTDMFDLSVMSPEQWHYCENFVEID